jgi:hypothetical protein
MTALPSMMVLALLGEPGTRLGPCDNLACDDDLVCVIIGVGAPVADICAPREESCDFDNELSDATMYPIFGACVPRCGSGCADPSSCVPHDDQGATIHLCAYEYTA